MSDANQELTNKLSTAKGDLEAILKMREKAENAVVAAEGVVEERRKSVVDILSDEGKLRGTIGELEKMQNAFDAAPEEHRNA